MIKTYRDASKCESGLSASVSTSDPSESLAAAAHAQFNELLKWALINQCDQSALRSGANDASQGHFFEFQVDSVSRSRVGTDSESSEAQITLKFGQSRAVADARVNRASQLFEGASNTVRLNCVSHFDRGESNLGECVDEYQSLFPYLPGSALSGHSVAAIMSSVQAAVIRAYQVDMLLRVAEESGAARKIQAHRFGLNGTGSYLVAQ